jgi:hypothetical protein
MVVRMLNLRQFSRRRVLALVLAKTGRSNLFSQHFSSVGSWFREAGGPEKNSGDSIDFQVQQSGEGGM